MDDTACHVPGRVHDRMPRTGWALLGGGALWLTAVALLESGRDIESVDVRASFALAGLLIGADLYALRSRLPARAAKLAVICTAVACLVTTIGFAIGTFIGFLASYFGLLFAIPLGLALLGVGLFKGGGLPRWASWIPVLLAAAGAVAYGFHALARNIWDPPDAVLFVILGVGWLLLGSAALSPPTRAISSA